MNDKEFAIDRIKRSMATHSAWLDHFAEHDCQDWARGTVGDADHQRQVLAEYRRVVELLESIDE